MLKLNSWWFIRFSVVFACVCSFLLIFSPQIHTEQEYEPVKDEYVIVVPRVNPGGMSKANMASIVDGIASALSEKTGIGIKVEFENSKHIAYRLKDRSADFAFIPGKDYGYFWRGELPVRPLVTYTVDNEKTHRVCLYVNSLSGIESVSDLKGGVIDIPSIISEYSYALRGIMEDAGITEEAPVFFREIRTVQNPRSVALGLVMGDIDGAVHRTDQMKYVLQGDTRFKDIKTIACSMELPNGLVVYRRDVNPEAVRKIGGALLGAHSDPAFTEYRFIFFALNGRLVKAREDDYRAYHDFYSRAYSVGWSPADWILSQKEARLSMEGSNIDLLLELAALYLGKGEYGKALPLLKRVIRLDPDNRYAGPMVESAENAAAETGGVPVYEDSSSVCPAGMAHIPAGEFSMGNDGGGFDERPARRVHTDSYCIDEYEYPNQLGMLPIGSKWSDAVQTCKSAGKRLCTEAEWEKACRGPEEYQFPYGVEYIEGKCPAGLKRKDGLQASGKYSGCVSGYGVYDMSGGINEWVEDRYEPYPGGETVPAMAEDRRVKRGGPRTNKRGAASCSYREGGSVETNVTGFRCCMDARPAEE